MSLKAAPIAVGVFVVFAALLIVVWQKDAPAGTPVSSLKVAVTIFPLYDIVREVGGARVETVLIVPPAASPHTFEFTPEKVRALQGTSLIFMIGHGLDDWVTKIGDAVQGARFVAADRGIALKQSDEEGGDGNDPHYWLDPLNAGIIASMVADELAAIDREEATGYRERAAAFGARMERLFAVTNGALEEVRQVPFITMHDAWGYFVARYGLNVVGAFEPFPGRVPTPQYLRTLEEAVRGNGVKVLFTEPQLSTEALKPFVKDLGLSIATLDAEGGGVEGRETYEALIKYNVDTIVRALAK